MDKVCVTCGAAYGRPKEITNRQWANSSFCSQACYFGRAPIAPEERFWRHVRKGDGCWEWQSARGGNGYGSFGLTRERMTPAHRFSWELHYGPIPDGLFVCHHCDNRLCVRPDHLFLGTHGDNMADMVRKGRHRNKPMVGVANPKAKLTEDDVRAIRTRRAAGETCRVLAAEFGVSTPLISYIVKRKQWTHVA